MQSLAPKTLQSTLLSIKKNLEGIRTVTSSTVVIQKNQQVVQKRQKEQDLRKKKEDKLESFKSFLGNKKEQIAGSGKSLGLIDYIKNFATFVFWGFLLNKLLPHLPKLKQILPAISWLANGFGWLTDLIGNSVVNFIDTAYKVQDTLRGVAKDVGGVKFEKAFDDFTKTFNTFLSLAVIGGIAAAGSGVIPKVLGKGLDKLAGKGAERATTTAGRAIGKGASKITTSGGRTVAQVGQKAAPRLLSKIVGNSAPIIGPLINFGIRVWSGDDPGKAAAGSVGMGIGQAIGGFLGGAIGGIVGSVVPILGNALVGAAGIFVGQIIGGLVGEWIGDSLYDFATSGNKKPRKTEGRAGGGVITRNGVPVGGRIKRTVKPAKKSLKKPEIRKSVPGKNVGGKKIEKIFPNPKDDKKVNPLQTLTYAAQKYNSISLVGGLLRAGVEGAMGQSMDPNIMKNFATNIGVLVQNIVDGNIKSTNTGLNGNILAMATGGLVPERTAGLNQPDIGEQVGTLLAKSLNLMVNNRMNEIFQNIMKQYGKEDFFTSPTGGLPSGDGSGGLSVSSDSPDFWLLATAAMFENSDPQGAADVAQAIYNRTAMPGDPWHTDGSIRKTILNPNQFQPVRDYGGTSVWNKITDKQSAIDFIQRYGRGKNTSQLDVVAAALLDPIRQNSARTFVGPRDSFRSVSYEAAKNHLADDTEVRRAGHVFGFEPRGATIASFRAGRLKPAEINKNIVGDVSRIEMTGSVSGYTIRDSDGKIISNYNQLSSYHDGQRASGGRIIQDFVLFQGEKYVNVPVLSPATGRVKYAGYAGRGGLWVEILTDNGEIVELGHFNKLSVQNGQKVTAFSTVLGLQGHTGRTIPPGPGGTHVHMQAPEGIFRRYINTLAKGSSGMIRPGRQMDAEVVKPGSSHNHASLGLQNSMSSRDFGSASGVGGKGYIIVPGHAAGGGAPGEKALVKKLARNAYNNIRAKNPNIKIQYVDVDDMFPDTDAGFARYLTWVHNKEKEGYEVLEVHMDAKGGTGRGVIVPVGEINPAEARFAKKYGAYNRGYRNLGNPNRGASIFELGNMTDQLIRTGGNKQQLDLLTKPFEESVLGPTSSNINRPRAQISAVPQTSRVSAQSIATYDSTTTRTQTIVAYQQVIQPQPTPVPVSSKKGLFPGETANVNTDRQLQAKALA